MRQDTIVMKFGGASVASPDRFSSLADLIIERQKSYAKVVVVVSAMGDSTDQLIELAKQVNPSPPRREYDMLVSVGERISISLLAMALAAKGHEAVSFTGSQSGIITCPRHSEARIIDVRPHRLHKCLEQNQIAIVAGFQGVSHDGAITTLGRGGSDTTAVALGVALESSVEFFKDVKGIYNKDPHRYPEEAILLPELSYEEAENIICTSDAHQVLHPRCIALAKNNHIPLHIWHYHASNRADRPGTSIKNSQSIVETVCKKEPLYEKI